MTRFALAVCCRVCLAVLWYAAGVTFMTAAIGFVVVAVWKLLNPTASRARYGVLFNVSAIQATPFNVQLEFDYISTKYATVRVLQPAIDGVNLLSMGRAAKLTMLCGITWSDASSMQHQLDLIVLAVLTNPSTCAAVFIGNDDLAGVAPNTLKQVIVDTRAALKKAVASWKPRNPNEAPASQIPVGIAQSDTQWLSANASLLATYCDVVGVNLHLGVDDNIDVLDAKWNTMKAMYGSKPRLTSTQLSPANATLGDFDKWSHTVGGRPIFSQYKSPYAKW